AKQEDWENYRIELNKRIVRAEPIKRWIIDPNPIAKNKIEGALNSMWGTIEKSILETAMKHIPKKKICNTKSFKINRKRPRLDKIIVELSRWVKYTRKKVGNKVTEEEKEDFEKFK
ncbi:19522_t:CDS:1, partial [Gigaspora rosea]